MNPPVTKGIHHLGLTVSKLEESANFFVSLLGWKEVRRNPEYPAIYVSDGKTMVTLWAIRKGPGIAFDRESNTGLHHVAFQVASEADLKRIHARLLDSGTAVEFAPEALGKGAAKHMICLDPSGIRIEFIWPGS